MYAIMGITGQVGSAGQGMPEGRTDSRAEMVDGFNSGWIDFGVPGTEHIKGPTSLTPVIAKLVANGSNEA